MAKRGSWYFEGYQSEIKLDAKGRERETLLPGRISFGGICSGADLRAVKNR